MYPVCGILLDVFEVSNGNEYLSFVDLIIFCGQHWGMKNDENFISLFRWFDFEWTPVTFKCCKDLKLLEFHFDSIIDSIYRTFGFDYLYLCVTILLAGISLMDTLLDQSPNSTFI